MERERVEDRVGTETAGQPRIRCEGLRHEYTQDTGRGRLRSILDRSAQEPTATSVTALDDVTLTVQPGEVVGLAGPSGSGKSTLLHAMAGLLDLTAGTLELDGTDVAAYSSQQRARLRRREIGLVFQRFHLLPSLTARANVGVPLVQAGVPKRTRRDRAAALLDRVDLADRMTHRPAALSGGEQQRVAIARALATDPAVVLADEPTGELDTETGRRVLDFLVDAADDRTVVLASHDETTLNVADRIVRLRDGRVVDDGR